LFIILQILVLWKATTIDHFQLLGSQIRKHGWPKQYSMAGFRASFAQLLKNIARKAILHLKYYWLCHRSSDCTQFFVWKCKNNYFFPSNNIFVVAHGSRDRCNI
jgi:hypothetical protein